MLFVKYSSDCENETVCAAALRTEATANDNHFSNSKFYLLLYMSYG